MPHLVGIYWKLVLSSLSGMKACSNADRAEPFELRAGFLALRALVLSPAVVQPERFMPVSSSTQPGTL